MPTWNDLLKEVESRPPDEAGKWLDGEQQNALNQVSQLRGGKNVILYASALLQKPFAPGSFLQPTHEEINGFMSVMYGMDWAKGLTLIPMYAMSAGTMISMSCNRIVMGRQSQLGPIDPQLPLGGGYVSARAIVEQFERAKDEILKDLTVAHVWAPILASIGPALLQEAQNALDYGESMVARWLCQRMFTALDDPKSAADATAKHFNDASKHKSHGRRIDRVEARANSLVIEDFETSQPLQEAVLTAYHIATIIFEKSPATKLLLSSGGRAWMKNLAVQQP